jgi:hypothetical protein
MKATNLITALASPLVLLVLCPPLLTGDAAGLGQLDDSRMVTVVPHDLPSSQTTQTTPLFLDFAGVVKTTVIKPEEVTDFARGLVMSTVATKNQPWDKIDFGSRKLTNNVWGAGVDETFVSSIFIDPQKSFGWAWERNDPRPRLGENCTKPIFPSVRIGGSPWEASNTAQFPIKVADLKSLTLDLAYNYPVVPTGSYNLAYDIFLSDNNKPTANPQPKAEVMIWLHNTFQQPVNSYKGEVSDGTNIFKLYSWVLPNGREYYSFILKDQSSRPFGIKVDAGKLLYYLNLNQGWYVPGVELGNEINSGSGKIEITRLVVSVNGIDL